MSAPKTFEAYMRDTKNTFIYGVPAQQYYSDLWLWEKFFIAYPIKTLIELGTGSGGLTLFFRLHAVQQGLKFKSYDIDVPEAMYENLWTYLDMYRCFVQGDIFNESRPDVVELIQTATHPIMLYCDNGDKPKEVKEFGLQLVKGDFIAVHDWGTEFTHKDIPVSAFEEIFTFESEICKSRTRWMRKII